MAKNPWASAIRRAIKNTGLTVPALAKQSGISKSLLYNWRNPDSFKPNEENLQRLADHLGIPIAALTDSPQEMLVAESSPSPSNTSRTFHGHFSALHERASAEQRLWIAQLMLDTLEANVRDMREILTPAGSADERGRSGGLEKRDSPADKRELAQKLAESRPASAEKAKRAKRAQQTVMRDADSAATRKTVQKKSAR